MDVFFVGSLFETPTSGGGIYNSIIAKYLKKQGINLTLIDFPWGSIWNQVQFDFNTAKSLYKLSRKQECKVIFDESLHQRMFMTLFVLLFRNNLRTIIMLHQLSYMKRGTRIFHYLSKMVDTFILRKCDAAISAGQYVGADAAKLANKSEKIKYALTTLQGISAENTPKEKFFCAYAGSVTERKGLLYLVEALHLLPREIKNNLHVDILGNTSDTVYLEQVKKQIAAYDLEANFNILGHQPFEKLSSVFSRSSLFLFPSLWDNMPMVLLEAMGFGCIPIAFNNSGTAYYVREGNTGLLADDRNAHSFAEKIEQFYLLEDAAVTEMRENAIKESQKFQRGWDEVGEDFLQAVKSV